MRDDRKASGGQAASSVDRFELGDHDGRRSAAVGAGKAVSRRFGKRGSRIATALGAEVELGSTALGRVMWIYSRGASDETWHVIKA